MWSTGISCNLRSRTNSLGMRQGYSFLGYKYLFGAPGPLMFEKPRLLILDLVIALNFDLFLLLQSCSEICFCRFAALVES